MTPPDHKSPITIIFLVVDGLRADRLRIWQKNNSSLDFLRYLSTHGVAFSDVLANGCPTQFAFPALLSSTLPLDHKGYEYGISGRPTALAEEVRAIGFQTFGLSQCHYTSRMGGYDRGFDSFDNRVGIATLFRTLDAYRDRFRSLDQFAEKDVSAQAEVWLGKFLRYLSRTVTDQKSSCSGLGLPLEPTVEDAERAQTLLAEFQQNPAQFVERFLNDEPMAHSPDAPKRADRAQGTFQRILNGNLLLLCFVLELLQLKRLRRLNKTSLGSLKLIYLQAIRDLREGPNSEYARNLLERFYENFISQRIDQRSFFFIHLNGLHDRTFIGPSGTWLRDLRKFRRKASLAVTSFNLGLTDFLYDLSMFEVDDALATVLPTLAKDAVVVLSSDHGIPVLNDPDRDSPESTAQDFFNTLYEIPLLVVNPNLQVSRIANVPLSALDIPSMILEFAGGPKCNDFRGRTFSELTSLPQSNAYRIAEHCGPGIGDPTSKPIFIAISMRNRRIVFKFPSVKRQGPSMIREVIDSSDPHGAYCQEDLASSPSTEELYSLARSRWLEISSFFEDSIFDGYTNEPSA